MALNTLQERKLFTSQYKSREVQFGLGFVYFMLISIRVHLDPEFIIKCILCFHFWVIHKLILKNTFCITCFHMMFSKALGVVKNGSEVVGLGEWAREESTGPADGALGTHPLLCSP